MRVILGIGIAVFIVLIVIGIVGYYYSKEAGYTKITVLGNRPWTYTGIKVKEGDVIEIKASGKIKWGDRTFETILYLFENQLRSIPARFAHRRLAGFDTASPTQPKSLVLRNCSCTLAALTMTAIIKPIVSTKRCRLRPLTCLWASYPLTPLFPWFLQTGYQGWRHWALAHVHLAKRGRLPSLTDSTAPGTLGAKHHVSFSRCHFFSTFGGRFASHNTA